MTDTDDVVTFRLKKVYLASAGSLVVGLALGFAGGIWASGTFGSVGSPSERAPAGPGGAVAAEPIEVSVDGRPSWGPDDATVTVVEFTDYQCPYCSQYFRSTYPALRSEYADRIKYVVRNFPITSLHPHAAKAAEAAECAADQDQFWAYHELLFEGQTSLDAPSLIRYATELGLDTNRFDECLTSGVKEAVVAADLNDGYAYGVTGTPTFFVNGRKVAGAQPFPVFKALIEQSAGGTDR